jgi:outer membrane protein TolC
MTMARSRVGSIALAALSIALAAPLPAAAQDTLRLGDLQRAAERTDRRAAQAGLLAEQSLLRLRSLREERLPAIGLLGRAQYLSDVPSVAIPGGPPAPPHDNYDASLELRQRLLDPTSAARRDVERAQLAESQARLRTALYAQRDAVNDAFFLVLRLDAQRATLASAVTELEAQRDAASQRASAGAGLPSETNAIDAELLRRRQAMDLLAADRDAARAVLASLAGRPVAPDAVLQAPDEGPGPRGGSGAVPREDGAPVARPELNQFARARELLDARRAVTQSGERPRLSAFARAGYGRPGLNPLATEFDSYWLAGVQVEWSPWDWGTRDRDAQVLTVQSDLLRAEEGAFLAQLDRRALAARATMDALGRALESDERIIALRRAVLDEARLRFAEGVLTSAEFIDRQADLLDAELARDAHRVQRAEARARLMTILGRETR